MEPTKIKERRLVDGQWIDSERTEGDTSWTPAIWMLRERDAPEHVVVHLNPDGTYWADWPLIERVCVENPLPIGTAGMENEYAAIYHMLLALRDGRVAAEPWSELVQKPEPAP